MTKDILIVTGTDQTRFAREVFQVVNGQERQGYTCEIKFSTSEQDAHYGRDKTSFSALIHVYETE